MSMIIAVVGMPGSGKSTASDILVDMGLSYIRLGQLTIEKLKEAGLEVNEHNERRVREGLRREHGPAAYAILNFPKIDEMAKRQDVVVDGLYSWAEYLEFKSRYKEGCKVLCIYASPKTRYARLAKRAPSDDDPKHRDRALTAQEAWSRDKSQLENMDTGGPIAMADYTVVNEGSRDELDPALRELAGAFLSTSSRS